MKSTFRKVYNKLRRTFLPSEQDKELKRWFSRNDDEELRYDYDLNSDSLVIDLGGYKGQWASDIYARYNCRIMIFEPAHAFAKIIEKRFAKNPKIEIFHFALGDRKRQEILSLSADGSSVYREGVKKENIQFEDVADYFTRKNIISCDLMKVNIEGGEYELLPRLIKTGLIKNIRNLQIQFHNLSPDSEKHMELIHAELAKTHTLTYQYKFVWENWELV